ncbi:hypothetical protein N825_29595 [Skermanella stibiiresistens SB22]|uniref:Uncharacterized protein n=1 Tax=Skermanella stibiiresistens SB22 TaxID=1385369 RepID=W9GUM6_9PROT|nr:hypothetical protein N825_29595 [Skermanella stibiiresistens SB22]
MCLVILVSTSQIDDNLRGQYVGFAMRDMSQGQRLRIALMMSSAPSAS